MFGKGIISFITCWYCHHSTCSVTCQYIIAYPNWYWFFGKRMLGISPSKYARNGFYICHSFSLTSFCSGFNIVFDRSFLIWSCNFLNQRMLGSKGHKCNAKKGVGAGGENPHPNPPRRGGRDCVNVLVLCFLQPHPRPLSKGEG